VARGQLDVEGRVAARLDVHGVGLALGDAAALDVDLEIAADVELERVQPVGVADRRLVEEESLAGIDGSLRAFTGAPATGCPPAVTRPCTRTAAGWRKSTVRCSPSASVHSTAPAERASTRYVPGRSASKA
jgi:hypothetical protein